MANTLYIDVESAVMLSRLANRLIEAYQGRQLQELPPVALGRELIESAWTQNNPFSPEFVATQKLKMMESVLEIATSQNPMMANREKLRNCVIEASSFNVLTFDPPPAEDITGFRGQVGISGELKAYILEIAGRDDGIRTFLHEFDEKPTEGCDILECIAIRGCLCMIWANLFHGLRYALNDCNKHGRDWYRPFLVALYGYQEARYRELLGLPSSIRGLNESEKRMKGMSLSLFVDAVDSGVKHPDLNWRDRLLELERGNRDWRKGTLLDF